MYQIRVHGLGGQEVVTAAELVAWAAICDGRFALAFPGLGSERAGAPVEAYCRIAETNLPMLGAFAAASRMIGIEAVHTSIELLLPEEPARANRDGADEAHLYLHPVERETDSVDGDVPASFAAEREPRLVHRLPEEAGS